MIDLTNNEIKMSALITFGCVTELLGHGFSLAVDDGGEELATEITTDKKVLLDALMNTEADRLYVYEDDKIFGHVDLIYCNDGYDTLVDYTLKLESSLTKTWKLSEFLEDANPIILAVMRIDANNIYKLVDDHFHDLN